MIRFIVWIVDNELKIGIQGDIENIMVKFVNNNNNNNNSFIRDLLQELNLTKQQRINTKMNMRTINFVQFWCKI